MRYRASRNRVGSLRYFNYLPHSVIDSAGALRIFTLKNRRSAVQLLSTVFWFTGILQKKVRCTLVGLNYLNTSD